MILPGFQTGPSRRRSTSTPDDLTGDVKYHLGWRGRAIATASREVTRQPRAQPEPPGVRQPGGRSGWRGPRRTTPSAPGAPTLRRARRALADPDSRRRGLPRPGRRGRDAQPVAASRLHHRRHDPHHRQQPDRLHHRPGRMRARRSTPATWPRASRSRSCTSMPTTPRPASRSRGWRRPTATASARTS